MLISPEKMLCCLLLLPALVSSQRPPTPGRLSISSAPPGAPITIDDQATSKQTVVLAKSDLIDKLGVVLFPSIPLRASLVRSFDRTFRLVSEPCGAPTRDPRAPPSARRSSAFRQATETDTGGSMALGLAMRRLERLAIQRLHRQGFDCHRLASERLSPVLGLEDPTR